ncbi:hypothetical protein [Streptomyces sp. NRRL F-5755]|uniref:hypothetical protein n=1 Tax=Streptomyces sp. NRRL F-5755 TaxID=1519475 RepID=UPI0018FE8F9F|nr:hypothetical protein [Streptomyces sp. NRRL F-5755]
MNESRFGIDQQARPPAQRVRGGREAGEVMARLLAGTRRELLSLDDPSDCLEQQISERLLARAASLVRTAVDRVLTVRRLTSRPSLSPRTYSRRVNELLRNSRLETCLEALAADHRGRTAFPRRRAGVSAGTPHCVRHPSPGPPAAT